MSLDTVKKALELFCDSESYPSIGGGEPTLHPQFWEIIGLAMGASDNVWLATNGSQTQTALRLARLAMDGKISVALSQDDYHDAIDPRVVEAFTKQKAQEYGHRYDNREIRDNTDVSRLLNHGRAKKIAGVPKKHFCCCSGPFIKPNGDIMQCGCVKSPKVGNVHSVSSVDFEIFEYCGVTKPFDSPVLEAKDKIVSDEFN